MMQKLALFSKLKMSRADDEFIYFIAFLYSISTSEANAIQLFQTVQFSNYGRYTKSIKEIFNLGVGWKYGLSKSCELISTRVSKNKEDQLKQFLVRIAQVIRLGDELRSFLKHELDSANHYFLSAYEQRLESQKLFLEMFYTLMSTTSIMVAANSLLIMLMGGVNGEQIMLMAFVGVIAAMGGFVFMLYIIFPRNLTLASNYAPMKKLNLFFYVSVFLSASLEIILYFSHVMPTLITLIISGIPITIVGYFFNRLDSKITKYNNWYPALTSHFGQIYATLGSVSHTLDAVLRSDFGPLQDHVKSLNYRIKHKINMSDAFEIFSKDVGSVLIRSGNTIVSSSLLNGADMNSVGITVADITRRFNEVKTKRSQLARTFEMIVIMMHVLTLAVFGLMNKITSIFTFLIQGQTLSQKILPIHPLDPHFMDALLPIVVLSMSIITGFAIKVAQGGIYRSVLFYIGLLMILGAAVMYGTSSMLSHFLDTSLLKLA